MNSSNSILEPSSSIIFELLIKSMNTERAAAMAAMRLAPYAALLLSFFSSWGHFGTFLTKQKALFFFPCPSFVILFCFSFLFASWCSFCVLVTPCCFLFVPFLFPFLSLLKFLFVLFLLLSFCALCSLLIPFSFFVCLYVLG